MNKRIKADCYCAVYLCHILVVSLSTGGHFGFSSVSSHALSVNVQTTLQQTDYNSFKDILVVGSLGCPIFNGEFCI